MICPECKSQQTCCKDSRLHKDYRRRRYMCMDCGTSFSTKESWYNYKIRVPHIIADNFLAKYLAIKYNTGNWTTSDLFAEAIKLLDAQLRYAYPSEEENRICAIAYLALIQLNKGET